MQAVVNTTRAVSGGLTGVSTPGLDSNVTMKARDFGSLLAELGLGALRARLKCRSVSEAGDCGALLPDLALCVFMERLECRHFLEVPRACQSRILPISPKVVKGKWSQPFSAQQADGRLPRLPRPLARSKKIEVTLPVSVKQAIIPVLDRDIWRDRMTTSMSRCCFVLRSVEKEEREEILQATDSVFRPMSWSRRLKASQALDSDSQLCGPPVTHCAHEPLHLNDIWTPFGPHPEPAEAEDLPCRELRPRTDLAEDAEERVELRKGCRLLTVQSRKRYPLATTARTQRTPARTQRTKRRKEVLCDVAENTGAAKLVVFSGALRMGRTSLTLAGIDTAGWPHDSFSQIDLGDKLALQNPFESVLIETGALLQECEPEELVVVTMSYGGTSGYRLASNIERATGRTVRGVVMWDFLTSFGRGIQGPPLLETPAFKTGDMKGMDLYAHGASASPDFRCCCEHPIQMVTGYKTGELPIDLLMNRERSESAIKVMYKKLQIQKVQECHFGYERSNWDILRLLLSTSSPKTADAVKLGDIGAA